MKLANQKSNGLKVLEDDVDDIYTPQYLCKIRVKLRIKYSRNNIQHVFVDEGYLPLRAGICTCLEKLHINSMCEP